MIDLNLYENLHEKTLLKIQWNLPKWEFYIHTSANVPKNSMCTLIMQWTPKFETEPWLYAIQCTLMISMFCEFFTICMCFFCYSSIFSYILSISSWLYTKTHRNRLTWQMIQLISRILMKNLFEFSESHFSSKFVFFSWEKRISPVKINSIYIYIYFIKLITFV